MQRQLVNDKREALEEAAQLLQSTFPRLSPVPPNLRASSTATSSTSATSSSSPSSDQSRVSFLLERLRDANASALLDALNWFQAAVDRTEAGRTYERLRVGGDKLLAAVTAIERNASGLAAKLAAAGDAASPDDVVLLERMRALATQKRSDAAEAVDLAPTLFQRCASSSDAR